MTIEDGSYMGTGVFFEILIIMGNRGKLVIISIEETKVDMRSQWHIQCIAHLQF